MERNKNKLLILESEETLEITIPPARFTNHLTTVFLISSGITSLFIAIGFSAAFYAQIVFKIVMSVVFALWLWTIKDIVIEFFGEMFFNTTKINVSSEKIDIIRTRSRDSNNYLSLPVAEIVSLRLSIRHTDSIDIYPQLFFKTKDTEYSIHRFTWYNFSNDEITEITEKISNLIKKDIVK